MLVTNEFILKHLVGDSDVITSRLLELKVRYYNNLIDEIGSSSIDLSFEEYNQLIDIVNDTYPNLINVSKLTNRFELSADHLNPHEIVNLICNGLISNIIGDWKSKLTGSDWYCILHCNPKLIDECNPLMIDQWDWVNLLKDHHELYDHCPFEKLEFEHWRDLMDQRFDAYYVEYTKSGVNFDIHYNQWKKHPELLKCVDFSKLSSSQWEELQEYDSDFEDLYETYIQRGDLSETLDAIILKLKLKSF